LAGGQGSLPLAGTAVLHDFLFEIDQQSCFEKRWNVLQLCGYFDSIGASDFGNRTTIISRFDFWQLHFPEKILLS
jgi:hypothetical protein